METCYFLYLIIRVFYCTFSLLCLCEEVLGCSPRLLLEAQAGRSQQIPTSGDRVVKTEGCEEPIHSALL